MSVFASHTTINDFWAEAAEKSVHINHDRDWKNPDSVGSKENHFARIIQSGSSPFTPISYIEELVENDRDNLRYPAVIAESTKVQLSKSSSLYSSKAGAIIILCQSGENYDFDRENDALNQSEILAGKFFAYLEDYLKQNIGHGKLLHNQCVISRIGPVMENKYFGARLDYMVRVDSLGDAFCKLVADWT